MKDSQYNFGMIGLGTMGRNLVNNMASHGFAVAGFDKDPAKVAALKNEAGGNVYGAQSLHDFVSAIARPRTIMLLVPAGQPVDDVVAELKPLLNEEDLIMDCGNSHFIDTDRRIKELVRNKFHFMGVGISGGEEGARKGPSIMPGGNKKVFDRVGPMLAAIAAKVNNEPCTTYLGQGSAGHYVKMVHNGIEYALMQLIAETYQLLKEYGGFTNGELHNAFDGWNKGPLKSFLVEITAEIFTKKDELTSNYLVDMIQDSAGQKGTGIWTSQSALDLQVPVPSIDAAVTARVISANKEQRLKGGALKGPGITSATDKEALLNNLGQALQFSMLIAYAQGMALLQKASAAYNYGYSLSEVAKIWRGGCIIRAEALELIMEAYNQQPGLANLMFGNKVAPILVETQQGARLIIKTAVENGIAAPAMMAGLAYYDGYRKDWLPSNLIQAQRDYFGAHTYKRTDRDGIFHTEWNKN
ncbi:MAG TPA: NADP-dependent phosphogluconate dehydrogenase [Chitinophagales bacterium]|nr:NADP-dependent phosphogluconate dehydrogenase [Chitinophagales bacterium]